MCIVLTHIFDANLECILNLFKTEEKAVTNKERKQITCAYSKCGKRFHPQRSNQHYCDKYCRWNHWKEDNPRKTVRVDSASGKRVISVTEEEFQLFQEWKKSRKSKPSLKSADHRMNELPELTSSKIEMEI